MPPKDFFLKEGVAMCCDTPLKIIFDTLFSTKRCIQQDLVNFLGRDKGYISRVVNGLEVPPLSLRLKIADFFSTPEKRMDSSLIWRYQDLNYIKKIMKEKKK